MRRLLSQAPTPVEDYPVIVQQAAPLSEPNEVQLVVNSDSPPSFAPASLIGQYRAEGYDEIEVAYTNGALTLETQAARFFLVHREGNKFGLASTKPVSLGINIEFFEVAFEHNTLTANLAAEPVVFSKTSP